MRTLDLNADLGEGMGNDDALLGAVSSASIACGGHAGDLASMRATLLACQRLGVRAGAHPGFADPSSFGRRRLDLPIAAIASQIANQLLALDGEAHRVGVTLAYVKLHGAMANMASEDLAFATDVLRVVRETLPGLAILALDGSRQVEAAHAVGLPVILEAYSDRAYRPDGQLVPRSEPDALIEDQGAVVERALRLARSGEIVAADGTVLRSEARSLCVHGDTPGAAALARRIRHELEAAGVEVAAATAIASRS